MNNVYFIFSKVFPTGLPEQFSFIATFRTRRTPKTIWHLIRVTDTDYRPQFLISLNPQNQTIEFSIVTYEQKLQTVEFDNPQVR